MTLLYLEPQEESTTLPMPEHLLEEMPLTNSLKTFIHRSRETIEAILNGWDPRMLLIVGPCSIHDAASTKEYAEYLSELAEEVSDHFFIVMRTYLEKPRTILGWKGILSDPMRDGSHQIEKGVRLARRLLLDLAAMGVPTASELLEPNTVHYYADLLSWGCIGARTSASPSHRQLAATMPYPIGFKNSTDGNLDHAIHGVVSANTHHVYLGVAPSGQMQRIQAEGNPRCHVVLRGSLGKPNYFPSEIENAILQCRASKVRERLVVDCSHDNSGKNAENQILVFKSVIEQIRQGNENICGVMLESHLNGGCQPISSSLEYGVSITDPCLSWRQTKELIHQAHQTLQENPAPCHLH